ncbi:MAG: branched-chain amino acid ABC transporter ATP-binding protein/permease [Alphaproteobacteria bacterium]|nr:branched-chain amino acid ABC transporter ATP-binding protein/permease [Alphaproteobacteria bacterium]
MSDRTIPRGGAARVLDNPWLGRTAILVLAVAIYVFPLIAHSDYRLYLGTQVGIYLLVAMGLNLLSGYTGQPSLCHGALLAIGAYVTAIATVDHGWSFWPAALVGMAITAGAGALIALPAFRVSAWYFALITLAFAEVVGGMLIEWGGLTHSFSGVVGIPMPSAFGQSFNAAQLFWLVATIDIACFIMMANMMRGRFGRGFIALRDNEIAARASGISLVRLKMFAFVVSAAVTGLAGAFYAVQKTVITPDDFTADVSIFFLVVVVLGGSGRLWGAALGTVAFFVVPELLTSLQAWRLLIYGVVLLALMLFAPHGLAGAIASAWRSLRVALGASPRPPPPLATAPGAPTVQKVRGMAVSIAGLLKRFGGVTALDRVSLKVEAGSVHAIVGPNGSGKTTLLNMICGFFRPDEGSIRLDDVEVVGRSTAGIARLGVGRTFQTPKLLPELTATENAMLGAFAAERASTIEVALWAPRARREHAALAAQAEHFLGFVGLGERVHEQAGELPHGQQRLAEIARALIGRPRLLLLDEPAAGLSLTELDKLGALIRSIADLGVTVVIVEHHLELVADICRHVTVLDRGTVLAEGTPDAVFADPAVIAAYMGARPLAEAAS